MTQLLHRACTAALWLGGICMVVMVVIVAWAVFGRFVLNDTPANAVVAGATPSRLNGRKVRGVPLATFVPTGAMLARVADEMNTLPAV